MASDSSPPSSDNQRTYERIARAAGLAGTATLVSRLLGLARDQVLAALFGAGNDMDAFVVALRVPNLLRDLFAEGAMSAAFVPTFTRHLTRGGKADAWRLGNNIVNALLLGTGAMVVLGYVFAGPLVAAFAEDFARVPGKLELTTALTRIVLPFLPLVAVATAVMGMLNSLQHYFVPALAPAIFNVATILCAIALAPVMLAFGLPPIVAVAIGATLGGVGQIAVQWPSLRREGFRYRLVLDVRDPALGQVLLLMGPGTLGLAATQVNLLVSTLLATSQGTGAVSWLQYAFRLMYLPIGLFGVSIATAVLPTVARQAALDDRHAVSRTVARGLGLMLVATVPATGGLLVLSSEIVQVLFERGRFLPSDTAATALALRCYALGLVGYSATRIATPVFYALGRSRIPVLLSLMSMAVNLVLGVTLVRSLGFSGLALATAAAAMFNGGASVLLLRRQLPGIEGGRLAVTFAKIVVASALMAVVVGWTLDAMVAILPGDRTSTEVARLMASIAAGTATVALAAKLLRIGAVDELLGEIRRRLPARPTV
jgi:putative peptidoglycan lipid II flippase